MRVLVDTTIWSLALRRRVQVRSRERVLIEALSGLVSEARAFLIGPIRQEILSGIPDKRQFEIVREHLGPFEDLPILTEDYEEAARMYNCCRAKGVQGSHVDFLICAVSIQNTMPVFTTDLDFALYAKHTDLKLYQP